MALGDAHGILSMYYKALHLPILLAKQIYAFLYNSSIIKSAWSLGLAERRLSALWLVYH